MKIERTNLSSFSVNQLPDGSRVIVDSASGMVFALNATAGAAWDACGSPTTLAAITERMQRSFDPATTTQVVEQAILQLEEKKLVKTTQTTRRQLLGGLSAAIALPLVVSLTLTDQRAYAYSSGSGKQTPPHKPPPPLPWWWPF
jgi:Coenzyme PQQ synthesis protein D (PqqD)